MDGSSDAFTLLQMSKMQLVFSSDMIAGTIALGDILRQKDQYFAEDGWMLRSARISIGASEAWPLRGKHWQDHGPTVAPSNDSPKGKQNWGMKSQKQILVLRAF